MRENAMPGPPSQPDGLAGIRTLPQLLRWRVKATPAAEAYRHFDPTAQRWVSQSWHEIDAAFELWRRALAAEAFAPGERVAILMQNGNAHIAMDQAALSRGLVPVPMHAVDNPDSIGEKFVRQSRKVVKAYFIGGGIGSLAGAAFLIRDAQQAGMTS